MSISESQLDTWSKQGSVTQSKNTYASIKAALESGDSHYALKSYAIFLQGSYGNDTNIYADSDVDVVIRIDSVYYDDVTNLNESEKLSYKSAWSAAEYSYNDFKSDVISQLNKKFPGSVTPRKKAIFVEGNGNRRDSDVLVAAQFRKYLNFNSWSNQSYIDGICFWTSDGQRIINYPKQHSENCTSKHQATNSWFKPTVRILKNMRNSMVNNGYLAEGVAPSYFLEGMLFNVPASNFGITYNDTVINALNWIINCDRAKLVCANEQHYLFHPTSPVTWRAEKLQVYLDATTKFWNEW